MSSNAAAVLADAILVLHLGFVLFVLGGLLAVWLGGWRRWDWVRNLRFRLAHLLAIGFVVAESLLGVSCPLTIWENNLRRLAGETAYESSFIGHWVHRLMFYEAGEKTFTVIYAVFLLAVGLSFWVVKPRRK